jgi:sodium-dependent dicarboxylate transporter 2/3/5
MPLGAQIAVATFATVFLTAIASNTAAVNIALNVLPPDLRVLTSTVLAASSDFALPAGTPPNAIVFASGYIRLPTMMRIGVVLDLCAALSIVVYVFAYASRLF